jgi:hypothetical protein
MLIIGGLGSFAGASPSLTFFCLLPVSILDGYTDDPFTLFLASPIDNSPLRSRDRRFPRRDGFLDWGTSGSFISSRERALSTGHANETVRQTVETSTLVSTSTYIPCSPSGFPVLPLDVQARPRCRDDRIPGYDHHDLHLSLCDW